MTEGAIFLAVQSAVKIAVVDGNSRPFLPRCRYSNTRSLMIRENREIVSKGKLYERLENAWYQGQD